MCQLELVSLAFWHENCYHYDHLNSPRYRLSSRDYCFYFVNYDYRSNAASLNASASNSPIAGSARWTTTELIDKPS